jgi:hypothetical protein
MTAHDLDHAVAVLARRQHGAFNWTQLERLGVTRTIAARRARTQHWVRLARGVYALRASEGTFLRQCWAAVLAMPDAVIAGLAAAAVLGLTDFRSCRPEVLVPRAGATRNPFATVHRSDGFRASCVGHLPVTTVAQTLCDIAPRVSVLKLERALDDHLLSQRGPPDLSPFEERVAFYERSRRPGMATIAALVAERQPDGWQPPASELERRLWRLLRRLPGRPRLVRQAPVPWRDAIDGRFDILIPTGARSSKATAGAGTPACATSTATAGATTKRSHTDYARCGSRGRTSPNDRRRCSTLSNEQARWRPERAPPTSAVSARCS